jgi:hypothetical protein
MEIFHYKECFYVMVFGGLAFLSLYIAFLPHLLALPAKLRAKKKPLCSRGVDSTCCSEQEVLIAIATAFHLNQDFPEENEKITWKSHGDLESPWKITGRVQSLTVRNDVGVNRLQRR